MSEPSYPPSPHAAPQPPPVPPAKKGMSTGCVIGLITGVVGLAGLVLIAVLVSLALPIFQRIQARALGMQTKVEMKELEMAIKGYQTEYSRLPVHGGTDEQKHMESEGEVIATLVGSHPKQNPRHIAFFDPPARSPGGKGGLITNAAGHLELYDSFGQAYRMHFDWNADGDIPDPEHPGATIPAATVLIYSAGPDLDYSTWKDNVKSWGP